MADQVTISTFLELRDNLSPALKRVADAIEASFGKMPKGYVQAVRAADQMARAEERAARQAERAARKLAQEQAKSVRAVSAMLREEERARARTDRAILRSVEKRTKEEIRLAAQAAKEKARIAAAGAAEQEAKGGLFSTVFRANLLANLASSVLSTVASTVGKITSFAYDAVSSYVEKGIRLNYEYEKSVSAISSAMYTMDISPSMRVAEAYTESVLGKLRELAAVLPGEASEYVEVYQRTIPQALMSGMRDSEKYAEFVSKYTAVAVQRGVGAKVAATNLQIMLQGTARAGTKMAQVLSAYTGKTVNEINRMTRAARFDLIQKAVDQAASGMASSATKADAIFGTLRTHLEDIVRMGSKPLFENAKGAAADLNEWFSRNKRAIIELSNTITEKLGFALRGALELAKDLAESFFYSADARASKKDPYERLAELTDPKAEMSVAEIMWSPAASAAKYASRQGEIMMLRGQIRKIESDAARMAKLKTFFEPREEKYGRLRTGPTAVLATQASQAAELIGKKMFDVPGRGLKDVFDEYLEYLKIPELRSQKIWEELYRRGVVKTRAADEDLAAATAPSDRARTYNDFRHSNFNIKQEFAEGFDPDRIAVAFSNDLARAGEMKLQAAYTLTGAVR